MKQSRGRGVFYVPAILQAAAGEVPADPGIEKGLIFFGAIVLAVGLVSLFNPRFFWYLRIGRKLPPGTSPGRLYLNVLRFGGILACALAVLVLLQAC